MNALNATEMYTLKLILSYVNFISRKINIFNLTFFFFFKQPEKTAVDNESIWNILVKEANSVLGMMHYFIG